MVIISQNKGKTHCIGDINNNQGTIINGDNITHHHKIIKHYNIDYKLKQNMYIPSRGTFCMPYDGIIIISEETAKVFVNEQEIVSIVGTKGAIQPYSFSVSKADKVRIETEKFKSLEITLCPIKRENDD